MKTSVSTIALALMLLLNSCCTDELLPHNLLDADLPMPHEILLLDFDSGSSSSKKEYCNEEPRLLVDHQISIEGSEIIQSFIDAEELRFVPLGTENIDILQDGEIWTWNKIEQDDEWERRKYKSIKCEENPDHYDKTYSVRRGAKFKFHDEKNGQTLKLHIEGLFDCVNGVPVGIKDERFTMMFQNESPFWCDPVVDYSIIDKTSNRTNKRFPELTVNGKKYHDVITMETTNTSHHYQIYIQKSKGIVLIQDLNSSKYWETIHNVKPVDVAALEMQRESDR